MSLLGEHLRPFLTMSLLLVVSGLGSWAGSRARRVPERQGDLFGLSTWGGRVVVEPRFERITQFRQGRAAAMIGGKWGFVDHDGAWVVEPELDWVHPAHFEQGPALVSKEGRLGYVDRSGTWVLPPAYEQASAFHKGVACVLDPQAMRSGLVDHEGLPLSGFRFDECDPVFSEDRARVRLGALWGYVDRAGEVAISPRFDRAEPFSEGLALIEEAGLRGFIDARGERRLPASGVDAGSFREGRAWVRYGPDQVGFIDRRGALVVEPRWRAAQDMSEGLAWVLDVRSNRWGAVSASGHLQIAAGFEDPAPFSDGLARVGRGGHYGVINRQGKAVIPLKYSQVTDLGEQRWAVATRSGGRVGVVDQEGQTLVPERYMEIGPFIGGLALATRCEWEQKGALSHARERCGVVYVDRDGRERQRR